MKGLSFSFTVLFLLSILLFFLYLIGSSFSSGFREGLNGNIPIKGTIYERTLTLDTAMSLSTGDILQTVDLKNIVDISQNPITISTGSTIAITKYALSGIVDPSGIIPYNTNISMNISTENMPDQNPIQIKITGIIPSNSASLTLKNTPSSTIKPGYLLLGSASNQLNDTSGTPLTIKSGSYPEFILSAVPNQDFITPDVSMNYIIQETK
jgi:hypothetical protein